MDSAAPVKESPLLASLSASTRVIGAALPVMFRTSIPAAAILLSWVAPPLLDKTQSNSLELAGGVTVALTVSVTASALANFMRAPVTASRSVTEIVLMPPLALLLIAAKPPAPSLKVSALDLAPANSSRDLACAMVGLPVTVIAPEVGKLTAGDEPLVKLTILLSVSVLALAKVTLAALMPTLPNKLTASLALIALALRSARVKSILLSKVFASATVM